MANVKKDKDIFGNEYTTDEKGNRYYHHKSIFFDHDVTYGPDGKEYTTHDSFFGGKVTYSSDGVTYRTHENIFGDNVTIGSDGSEYRTGTNFLGWTETRTIKGPDSRPEESFLNPQSDSFTIGDTYDPLKGLSQEQISKIYSDIDNRKKELRLKAIKRFTPQTFCYWFLFVIAFILSVLVLVGYGSHITFISKIGVKVFLVPIASFIIAYNITKEEKLKSFASIKLAIWMNHTIVNLSICMLAIISVIEVLITSGVYVGLGVAAIDASNLLIAIPSIILASLSSSEGELPSGLKKGKKRKLIILLIAVGELSLFVVIALWAKSVFNELYARLFFSIEIILLLYGSNYSYREYKKDRGTIVNEIKEEIESKIRREEELKTSPKYNTFIKIENIDDEIIENSLFPTSTVKRIKEKAKETAQSIKKSYDLLVFDALRGGRLISDRYNLNGWILEKYTYSEKTYKNDDREKLMEIYGKSYYYVLENTGELKVYNVFVHLENLNNEPLLGSGEKGHS